MAPNEVTTGHCHIQLRPGLWGAKPLEALQFLHFTIPQNELKSHVFPFKLQYKNNSNRLSNLLLDHLSFTVAAN